MIADQRQRDAALDPRRSFIVQAPAGSGKTELLVQRTLKLLQAVGKPEEVLAITFTKKAAAEMRKRVLDGLPDPAGIAHRLRIQTIDAFCTALTRQMPVLARFGAQPEVLEDASALYEEAAARVLSGLAPPAETLLRHLDNDVAAATRLLAGMLRSRDKWLRKTGAAPTRAELEAALGSERDRLIAKARVLHPKASAEFAAEMLTREFTWRARNAQAQALSGNEPLRQALAALCALPPAKYSDAQWQALESILSLLNPAVAQLKVLFGEIGKADFTEFVHGALQALGSVDDPSELLLSLDRSVSHILVDEFQDTSVSQWELLARLTAGWEPGDGRTLFLVGDPMQSIYRFREAEVALFLRAKNSGLGSIKLEPLTLATNFRSQASLVSWFNGAFSRILPAEEDEACGAVPYSPSAAKHPALRGDAVSWHCFYDRVEEASRVIDILRTVEGKSAILVRNRAHLAGIVPALNKAGIRFRAVEIEQLGEKQGVQDLYALTRALSHPADRVAWLAILRAPWCGLTLEDLLALTGTNEKDFLIADLLRNTGHLSSAARARIARVTAVLGPALAKRMRGGLRERVESAWLALGGPACVANETDLEDAEIFLDELERLEHAGEVDFEALAESIETLYALPDVTAGQDAVEIMTIHKAKGLEFDTVIVPGLDRLPRSGPKPLFAWKANGASLLLAPINETGSDKEPAYNYIRDLEREAEDIEAGRLFYVAATRAKSRLHLLACAKDDGHGAARQPARRSLLSKIWFEAEDRFGPAPAEAAGESPRAPLPALLARLPADFAVPEAPPAAAWRALEDARAKSEIEFSWASETARHVGTVAHRWLQRIAEDELRGWDAARVSSLKEKFVRELERQGVPPAELERSAELVATALKNSLADERGRWVLGPHAEARNECRLTVHSEGRTRSYRMDRVFVDQDGVRWIVDYKTSRHEGADVEAFLDSERERYTPQLKAYARAMGDARLGLYFPLLKGWRTLT
jgi:ATP-dependent exoDNAse (exonuclease V) beta subunit